MISIGGVMDCPECGGVMIIDEWDGWKWCCPNCGHTGRSATNEEIEHYESEIMEIYKAK